VTRPPRNRPLLVTGGAGFVGVNAAVCFATRGWRVIVADNLSRVGSEGNLRWARELVGERLEFVALDVRDRAALAVALRGAGAVLHLAAQVAVTTSLDDPRTDFDVNAAGTLNVLEVVRAVAPDAPVLFASTNKVYGALPGITTPVDEDQPLHPASPYACSKGAADQYVREYARAFGLATVVLRQSCIYGPHQHGNEDQGWVAHFARSILADCPLVIHGDGRQVRDLLEVRDLCALYLAAIDRIQDCAGEVLNVGGGADNARDLLGVIERLEELTGRTARYRFAEARPGDQRHYVSDVSRARRVLDWSPLIGVDDGLRGLVAWLRRQ
jgi:CDP-paratose 2-epimerase